MLHSAQKQSLGQGLAYGSLLGSDSREQGHGGGGRVQQEADPRCIRSVPAVGNELGLNPTGAFRGAMQNMPQNSLPMDRRERAFPTGFTFHVQKSWMCGAGEARCCQMLLKAGTEAMSGEGGGQGWGRQRIAQYNCYFFFFNKNVHSSFSHNSQKLGTIQESISRRIDKQNVAYSS